MRFTSVFSVLASLVLVQAAARGPLYNILDARQNTDSISATDSAGLTLTDSVSATDSPGPTDSVSATDSAGLTGSVSATNSASGAASATATSGASGASSVSVASHASGSSSASSASRSASATFTQPAAVPTDISSACTSSCASFEANTTACANLNPPTVGCECNDAYAKSMQTCFNCVITAAGDHATGTQLQGIFNQYQNLCKQGGDPVSSLTLVNAAMSSMTVSGAVLSLVIGGVVMLLGGGL